VAACPAQRRSTQLNDEGWRRAEPAAPRLAAGPGRQRLVRVAHGAAGVDAQLRRCIIPLLTGEAAR
jgi:hypothetical protein